VALVGTSVAHLTNCLWQDWDGESADIYIYGEYFFS